METTLERVAPTPLDLIQTAIEKGIDPDQLGKLMDLQERWERNRGEEAFGAALAAFQARCPTVFKRREAKGEKMGYRFASLDDVMREAGPVLSQCGICVSFDTEHSENARITVICRIRVGSYFEDRRFTSVVPSALRVTETQQYGAALSYLKRYALCAALNIVVTDEDNDANGLDTINADQEVQLTGLIQSTGTDLGRFLKWAELTSLEDMPRKQFPKALDMLKRKAKVAS